MTTLRENYPLITEQEHDLAIYLLLLRRSYYYDHYLRWVLFLNFEKKNNTKNGINFVTSEDLDQWSLIVTFSSHFHLVFKWYSAVCQNPILLNYDILLQNTWYLRHERIGDFKRLAYRRSLILAVSQFNALWKLVSILIGATIKWKNMLPIGSIFFPLIVARSKKWFPRCWFNSWLRDIDTICEKYQKLAKT